jgi:signal peptidase I
VKKFLPIIAVVVLVVLVAFGAKIFIDYHRTFVYLDGPAMEPAIHAGQEVRVHSYPKNQTPQREDIVEYTSSNKLVKQHTSSGKLIQRVVALPNERITISNGEVTVYSNQRPEGFNPDTYLAPGVVTSGNVDITLGPSMYFVMGDNRPDSLDSRIIGPIPIHGIIGKITTNLPSYFPKK